MNNIVKIALLFTITFVCSFKIAKSQCSEYDVINSKKIAIIFGEKDYKYAGSLNNPLNDAQDMSDSLKKLGFEVQTYQNTDLKTMATAIEDWYAKIAKYDVVLFYYSGHGAEVNGENYLVPIDADPKGPSDLLYQGYPVNRILSHMETNNTKFNIMILDACRSNPFKRNWTKDLKNGLAPMYISTTGRGSFIGFASSPGKVAFDGEQRNGTYTEAILKHITIPNLTIDQIFTKVNSYVRLKSHDNQIPFKNSSLSDDFCFSMKSVKLSNKPIKSSFTQPASGILLSSNEENIFTSDSLNTGISIRDSKNLSKVNILKINNLKPYKLTSVNTENVYIIDTTNKTINIVDIKKEFIKASIHLQHIPNSIAISHDESKAYLSDRSPYSKGTLSVIDLIGNKIAKTISTIDQYNGLAIDSLGKYLYAISQGNLKNRDLLIIDLKTDKIYKTIKGVSYGSAIGFLPNNKKLYVSAIGEGGVDQINILDPNNFKVLKSLGSKAFSFSFTLDSKLVFVLGESEILIIRTEDDTVINRLPFATQPKGVALSEDGRAYIWLPNEFRTVALPIREILQNTLTIDPENNLKKFKEDLKNKTAEDIRYRYGELFKKASEALLLPIFDITKELGDSYEYYGIDVNNNYKESTYSINFGIRLKIDNSKNIFPLYQAKFTDDFLIVSLKEKDKVETLKLPINNIEWEKVNKFVRAYFLLRIDQLR